MFEFTATTRIRRSAFYGATVAAGVSRFTTYNQMMMPSGFGDEAAEYWRLINGASLWDVAAQRQIQLRGRDAAALVQILSMRDLSKMKTGQGKYVALCNHSGVIINDPIVLKMGAGRFWFSISDSNILFWARAIAAERGLKVEVREVDASPLAVQGPLAGEVVAHIFGDWVYEIKSFWFERVDIDGIPLLLARSGWSKQGGYELYLLDGRRGTDLWNLVAEAGQRWEIGPGYPNLMERIESGLVSWGADTDNTTNPFEVRLNKFVDLHMRENVVGLSALKKIYRTGIKRHQLGLILQGEEPWPAIARWCKIFVGNRLVGSMTSGVWSPRLQRNIGFGLVGRDINIGDKVNVMHPAGKAEAQVVALPFL